MLHTAFRGLLPALATLLGSTLALAQLPAGLPKAPTTMASPTPMTADTAAMAQSPADTAAAKLDAALAARNKGDKAATVSALNAGVAAAEAQAATSKGDFKDKLMSQAGNLKKLIPGVSSGLVGGNVLSKAVSLVKMALGANQISSLLGGGGGLLGSVGALTGGLNLMKGALPAIGGGSAATTGNSLISNALAGVGKLSGVGGAAAEPAVKQQLGGVLNFAKGLL
ncbi:hypothetical protein FAES_5287 [Fibrella aestuarina BUZ 2]|uniref:Uncharacterized protein n=1 Tax=Fibrella aestuarina BUZ 2 TaxID=1166018 RepID=I0KGN3_9BACT|nr:hypothetical protein [Fibrella aestuarina]CCH03286.1 hypothetical protein FAES_5287 [Fibrella aestuarina BUZ 2]